MDSVKMYPVHTYHCADLLRFRMILLHLIGRQERRGRKDSAEWLAGLHEQIAAIENAMYQCAADLIYLPLYDRRLVEKVVNWVRANVKTDE